MPLFKQSRSYVIGILGAQKIPGTLWQRHLFFKALLRLCLTLCALFSLYILIDLSLNYGKHLYQLNSIDLTLHYFFDCLRRLPQILPFSLVLTTAGTLIKMHENRESLAISLATSTYRAIIAPFLTLSLVSGLLMLFLYEGIIFQTVSLDNLKKTEIIPQKSFPGPLRSIALNDQLNSWLIYHDYDQKSSTFPKALFLDGHHKWHVIKNLKIKDHPSRTIAQQSLTFYRRKSDDGVFWKQNPPDQEFFLEIEPRQLVQESQPASSLNVIEITQRLFNPFPLVERDLLYALLFYRLVQPLHCINATLIALFWTMSLQQACRRKSSATLTTIASIVSLALYSIIIQSGLLLASTRFLSPLLSIALPALSIPLYALFNLALARSAKKTCFSS